VSPGDLHDLIPDVENAKILSRETCGRLFRTHDLTGLGKLANIARERVSGNETLYRSAIHLHLAHIPVPHCPTCDRQRLRRQTPGSLRDWERAQAQGAPDSILELHLSNLGESGLTLERICQMIRQCLVADCRVGMRMFTARDLDLVAVAGGIRREDVLRTLADAGLNSLAGGVRIDLVVGSLCAGAPSLEDQASVMESCAELGMRAELVWICGDPEDSEGILSMLAAIRSLQDQWGVIACFTPLLIPPRGDTPEPTAYDQLRALAVSRLILDNIPHIRISRGTITDSMLQIGQWYGADDVGAAGHPGWDRIEESPSPEEMASMIREAGREPVDALNLPESSDHH